MSGECPMLTKNKIYIPIFIIIGFFLLINVSQAEDIQINDIVVHNFDNSNRIVIKLSSLTEYRVKYSESKVIIELDGIKNDYLKTPSFYKNEGISKIEFSRNDKHSFVITVYIPTKEAEVKHFALGDLGLITVDISFIKKLNLEQNLPTFSLENVISEKISNQDDEALPPNLIKDLPPPNVLPPPEDMKIASVKKSEYTNFGKEGIDKKEISYAGVQFEGDFPIGLLKTPNDVLRIMYQDFINKNYINCSQAIVNYLVHDQESPFLEDLLFMNAESEFQLVNIGDTNNYLIPINRYRLAIRKFPDSKFVPLGYMRIIEAYYNMEFYPEASGTADLSLKTVKSSFDQRVLYLKAESTYKSERFDESAATFEKFLTEFPKSKDKIQAYYKLGEINYFKGRQLVAYDYFKKGQDADPKYPLSDVELLFKIGDNALKNENYEKVRLVFKQLIQAFPASPLANDSRELIAESYFLQGKKKEALEAYVQFIDACEDERKTIKSMIRLADMGIEDQKSGTFDEDINVSAYKYPKDTYVKILEKYPEEELAQVAGFKLGQYYADNHLIVESLQVFTALLKQYPNSKIKKNIENFIALKISSAIEQEYKKGNYVESIRIYKDDQLYMVDANLDNKVFYYLGDSYYNIHLYGKAISLFEKVIQNYSPKKDYFDIPLDKVYYKIATIYSTTGEHIKAIHICDLLIQRFPTSTLVDKGSLLLGDELLKMERYKKAIEVLSPLARSKKLDDDEKLQSILLTAQCYKNLNDFKMTLASHREALNYFESRGEDFKGSTKAKDVLINLANVFYKNEDYGDAIIVLKQIADIYPQDSGLAEIFYKIGMSAKELDKLDEAKIYFEKSYNLAAKDSLTSQMTQTVLSEMDLKDQHENLFK